MLARLMCDAGQFIQFYQLIESHVVPDSVCIATYLLKENVHLNAADEDRKFNMAVSMLSRLGHYAAVIEAYVNSNKVYNTHPGY
jgi:hypothetical protein